MREAGNSFLPIFFLFSEDTTPPTVIQCPTSDVTAIVELGTGSTVVTYPEPLATDNSQSTMLLQSQTCTSGQSYNVGTTMCVYLFVDPTGNSQACTFNVVVSTGTLSLDKFSLERILQVYLNNKGKYQEKVVSIHFIC